MTDDLPSMEQCMAHLCKVIREKPDIYELALTELHYVLNKFDPDIHEKKKPSYRLVKDDFDPEETLKRIRTAADSPNLKIPEIRFKADQLSRLKQIPLPKSTRKHKEPLLQWFHIHWAELEAEVRDWRRK